MKKRGTRKYKQLLFFSKSLPLKFPPAFHLHFIVTHAVIIDLQCGTFLAFLCESVFKH